jgi:hypothetical protein
MSALRKIDNTIPVYCICKKEEKGYVLKIGKCGCA